VEIIDRASRHFADGELSGIFVESFLKLRLGTYRFSDLFLSFQQLLLQRLYTGVDRGTKRHFRNIREVRHLVVCTREAGTNRWRKILRVNCSNGEEGLNRSSWGPYS
jgi:hypothetical protein